MTHLIDTVKGALKLCLLHLQHPTTVNTKQTAAAITDALERLDMIAHGQQLDTTYTAVRAVIPQRPRVAVAPSSTTSHPVDVFIFDGDDLIDVYTGKTPAGIAEYLRLRYAEAA